MAALMLAVGAGSVALFAATIYEIWFRAPVGVSEPGSLFNVVEAQNYVRFLQLSRTTNTLSVAAHTRVQRPIYSSDVTVRLECVSPEYFYVLGNSAHMGRLFGVQREDDATSVVISHRFWRRRFGGDEGAIGSLLDVEGKTYTVVGVTQPGFRGVGLTDVDVWLTLPDSPDTCSFTGIDLLSDAHGAWLAVIARLRPSRNLPEAIAETNRLLRLSDVRSDGATVQQRTLEPLVLARRRELLPTRDVLLWTAAGCVSVAVLVIVNALSLLSLRARARQRHTAIRVLLGASPKQLVGEMLSEHLLLTGVSMTAAFGAAFALAGVLRLFIPEFVPEVPTLVFWTMCITGAFAFVLLWLGALPVSHGVGIDLTALYSAPIGRAKPAAAGVGWWQFSQLALATSLTVCALMFARTLSDAYADVGFDFRRLVVVAPTRAETTASTEAWHKLEDLRNQLERSGVVKAATISSRIMLKPDELIAAVPIRRSTGDKPLLIPLNVVGPTYFHAVGTRIVEGRAFVDSDDRGPEPVVILSAVTAAKLPNRVRPGDCLIVQMVPCARIVGISEPRRHQRLTAPSDELFVPVAHVRSFNAPGVAPALIAQLHEPANARLEAALTKAIDGWVSVSRDEDRLHVTTLNDFARDQAKRWRMGAMLFTLFALIALLVTATGIYSVTMLAVTLRMPEYGIRLALGAPVISVTSLVVKRWAWVTLAGTGAGIAAGYVAALSLRSFLFGSAIHDPQIWLIACGVCFLGSAVGLVAPLAKVLSGEPMMSLRRE